MTLLRHRHEHVEEKPSQKFQFSLPKSKAPVLRTVKRLKNQQRPKKKKVQTKKFRKMLKRGVLENVVSPANLKRQNPLAQRNRKKLSLKLPKNLKALAMTNQIKQKLRKSLSKVVAKKQLQKMSRKVFRLAPLQLPFQWNRLKTKHRFPQKKV